MLRALVVDDSATVRSLLHDLLSSDPQIEVVGLAKDGVEAVAMARRLQPDIVTMDIHMPRMDGFEATKEIMITAPTRIVIVTASAAGKDVSAAMSALRAGALTVLSKPPAPDAPEYEQAAAELLAAIKAMAEVKVVGRHRRTDERPATPRRSATTEGVAIAASTGGPQTLARLLGDLPRHFPAPILVVQHISAGFTAGLASWLGAISPLRVKVAEAGEKLVGSTVYLAPEDSHLAANARREAVLTDDPPCGGFRPSGTVLFRAMAEAYGETCCAVVLTGMGDDGVEGLRAVRAHGGRTLAQDEASSVVYGMPGAAARAGLTDLILPADKIAAELVRLTAGKLPG